jgi:class 3 adenylate cyclase
VRTPGDAGRERCFELIPAEVRRFEGTINQYTGDGVMALFGAPIATRMRRGEPCTPWPASGGRRPRSI